MKNKILEEKAQREEKEKQVRKWIKEILEGWTKYPPEEKHKITDRLPGELAYLAEPDRKNYIAAISKKKIINKIALTKKVNSNVELWKMTDEGETETKAEAKPKAVTKTVIPGIVGLMKEDNRVKYLTLEQGILTTQSYLTFNNVTYEPKQDLPFFYPTPDVFYYFQSDKDEAKLLADVEKFIRQYLELPDESSYLVLALWVLHTYLIDKFNCTPIIYFYGILETGKTRAGEVLFQLAYKGEFETSPTEAVLFRSSEYFKGSLILDELKIWGVDGDKEVARLIKARYKRGLKVARVDLNRKGEDQIEYFDPFAPIVICTDQSMPRELESRSLLFVMQKNTSPDVEDKIDQVKAQELRDRLIAFRARNLRKDLPNPEKIARRRLQEIIEPLHQTLTLVDPSREIDLKSYVKSAKETREAEERLSLQGEIIKAIIDSFYNGELPIEKGMFKLKDLTEVINQQRSENEHLKDRTISRVLKQLGLQSDRAFGGLTAFFFKEDNFEKLAGRFNVEIIKPTPTELLEDNEDKEDKW